MNKTDGTLYKLKIMDKITSVIFINQKIGYNYYD
jgi:hypothetical protein